MKIEKENNKMVVDGAGIERQSDADRVAVVSVDGSLAKTKTKRSDASGLGPADVVK